jgi:hypothetical protein
MQRATPFLMELGAAAVHMATTPGVWIVPGKVDTPHPPNAHEKLCIDDAAANH